MGLGLNLNCLFSEFEFELFNSDYGCIKSHDLDLGYLQTVNFFFFQIQRSSLSKLIQIRNHLFIYVFVIIAHNSKATGASAGKCTWPATVNGCLV